MTNKEKPDTRMYETLSAACDITLALGRRHHTSDFAIKYVEWDLSDKGYTKVCLNIEKSELQLIINEARIPDDEPTDMQYFALKGISELHNLDLVDCIEDN